MKRVPGCTRKPGQLLSVSNKGRGPTRRGIGRGAWHSTAADRIAAEQKADERADKADKKEEEEWRKAEQRADARAEKAAKQMYLIAVIYLIGWLVAPFLPGMVASVFPPS